MGIIRLENVTLAYQRHPAVHHLDAVFEKGSLTAVVGPNGSGKSTLLKGISGIITPSQGMITLDAMPQREIAYLPQQSHLDRSFPISVYNLVCTGAWRKIGPLKAIDDTIKQSVLDALYRVGLSGFEDRIVSTLSGGQFQRVLFARLLVQDSPIVLLDEPFNAIDEKTANDLLKLISEWHGERRTIITVLHDLDQVRDYFPRTLLLARELIDHGDTQHVLTSQNLVKAKQFCEAFDDSAACCNRRVA